MTKLDNRARSPEAVPDEMDAGSPPESTAERAPGAHPDFRENGNRARSAAVFAAVILLHVGAGYALVTAKGAVPPLEIAPPLEATIIDDTPVVAAAEPPPPTPQPEPPPEPTPPPPPDPTLPPPSPPPDPAPEPPPPPPQPEKPPEKPTVVPPKPEKPKHEPAKHEKPAKPHAAEPHPAAPAKSGPVAAAPSIDRSQSCPTPQYPREAQEAGATGVTKLLFVIDENGHVVDSRVASSSGYTSLDQAALRALSRCKFNPAITNGQRQKASLPLTYRWQLDN
jgi:protein TonB